MRNPNAPGIHEKYVFMPLLFIFLAAGIPVEFKDNPNAVIIRKCVGVLEISDSAHMLIDGSYYDNPNEKVNFHFDGIIDFPGDIDGSLKIGGEKVKRDGRIIMLDGRTYFQKSNSQKWNKLEENNYNQYEQNPLFMSIRLLLNLAYHPEYLKNAIQHSDTTLNEKKTDYFKLNIDIAKLRADASKSNQPEALKYFSESLTGKSATVEMWIEKKTGFLLKLTIDMDGWGKSKKPLSGSIILSDYNEPVKIERPRQAE